GMLLLSGIAPGGTYVNSVLLGALLSALGMGFTLVPATIVAMQGVAGAQSGVASGLLNTSRLVGGALGLAVLSTIAAAHTKTLIGAHGTGQALTSGFGLAFTIGAVLALTGAAVALFLLGEPPSHEVIRLRGIEEGEHEALAA
ncbi:MAG: hypothetical protein JO243_21905, partial [Solirubrobacterales bacterium]|nr:hypothetical protein [Solirubrobacterales bacterium]